MIKVMNMNKTIFFMTILLLAGVVSADAGNAFPQDEAGISAYVNVGESIDLEDAVGSFYQLLDSSETHAIGTVRLDNLHSTDYIHVYADINGWIVAYLERGDHLGMLVQWLNLNSTKPEIKITFEEAIESVCNEAEINYTAIEGNIAYYDFEYPNANEMSIFLNAREYNGYEVAHVHLPDTSIIYRAGYSLINTGYGAYDSMSQLYLDGLHLDYATIYKRILNEYDIVNNFTVGKPHNIQLERSSVDNYKFLCGMASVVVYS